MLLFDVSFILLTDYVAVYLEEYHCLFSELFIMLQIA